MNEARADAVLKYWWAQYSDLSGLQYVLSTQDAELPSKRRLGDTYLTDPVQHIDPKTKKIWFAGGPDIDKVLLVCLEASA